MYSKKFGKASKILAVGMGAIVLATPLAACTGPADRNAVYPLVLATDVLDGVFNPFFYTSGPDGEVVAQTQIGMISSDENGQLVANWNEPCVALDYGMVTTGKLSDWHPSEKGDAQYSDFFTDYYFALKDDIVFSDGTPLTKDDVLFNMYMYLDPAYTGSSTLYSVNIKGLSDYRAGIADPSGMDFDEYYESIVEGRINMIDEWANDAIDLKENFNFNWNDWSNYEYYVYENDDRKVIEKDIEMLRELFDDEIDSDWTMAMASDLEKEYERYKDKDGNLLFTEHYQAFLYSYGLITLDRLPDKDGNYYYEMHDNSGMTDHSEAAMKELIRNYFFDGYKGSGKDHSGFAGQLLRLLYTTSTGLVSFRNYLHSDAMAYYAETHSDQKVDRVSGIEVIQGVSEIRDTQRNADGSTVKDENGNDKVVTRQLRDKDGNLKSYDVLHITINGVDPKAIQNFGFTVAPGHYYSNIWNQRNIGYGKTYANPNFGVKFNDTAFMRTIRENHLPLGAGPYKAADVNGNSPKAQGDFFNNNSVYLRANESFMLGAPIIKNLRYQVVNSNMLYDAVKTGTVHYASPSMTQEQVGMLSGADRDRLNSASAENLGYGYIGISARYVPNLWVRRAIMSTLDPELCITYYGGTDYASIIRRPMSKTLKGYYSEEAFSNFGNYSYYPYGQEGGTEQELQEKQQRERDEASNPDGFKLRDEAKNIAQRYILDYGKCTDTNGDGILDDPVSGKPLRYTFTVAGNTDDHPAYAMLRNSAEILNEIGFDITLTQDANALAKLAAGRLTVWAAAWSSSSDPDMYQVYHKDSTATSTLAWGYSYILSAEHQSNNAVTDLSKTEKKILEDLSALIEKGRETMDTNERKDIYVNAQNKLMQLAVEFPTYQRKVYYVWGRDVFDENTLIPSSDVTTYQSPLSRIWEVSLKQD